MTSKTKKIVLILLLTFIATFNSQQLKAETLEITNIKIKNITDDSAEIFWATNKTSQGIVKFGFEKNNYLFWANSENSLSTSHKATLSNLSPQTTYYLRIYSQDSLNNRIISNETYFTTEKYQDADPPKISKIKILSTTGTTAIITWETNEPAKDVFRYGTSPKELKKYKKTYQYQTFHEISLTNLSPSTKYYFQFTSKDKEKNSSSSGILNFQTIDTNDNQRSELKINYLSPTSDNQVDIKSNSALVKVKTNRLTTATILYGENRFNKKIISSSPKKTEHLIFLTNLKPATEYVYKVVVEDIFGDKIESPPLSFKTKKQINNNSDFWEKPIKLIKVKKTPQVYAIYSNNKKHWIPSPEIFKSYGFKWEDIESVDYSEMLKYPQVTLIKSPLKTTVYTLKYGMKYPIYSAEVFIQKGYKWEDIITLSPEEVKFYPTGEMIY